MSKIGIKPILISPEVRILIDKERVSIKGPQGEFTIDIPKELKLIQQGQEYIVERKSENKTVKSLHGLYRQLISDAVTGVEKPWEKKLEIVGTGYNVKLQGQDLVFKLGFSHPIIFKKKEGVNYKVEGNTKVIVSSFDKQLAGEIAYQIKMLRKPDAYKGKGIRYFRERLRIKPGKKAKTAGTTV